MDYIQLGDDALNCLNITASINRYSASNVVLNSQARFQVSHSSCSINVRSIHCNLLHCRVSTSTRAVGREII